MDHWGVLSYKAHQVLRGVWAGGGRFFGYTLWQFSTSWTEGERQGRQGRGVKQDRVSFYSLAFINVS